jgi:hypothetical protein
MEARPVIECAGHPRDMGEAQGRACAAAVQAALREQGLPAARAHPLSLRAYTSGPVLGAGVGREIVRHFTHLSERIDGLARRAGAPVDSVAALHARMARSSVFGSSDAEPIALAMRRSGGESDVGLACSLPGSGDDASVWCLRHSRPTVGFESVEVTLPWLATSFAGVNASGLAAAYVPRPDAPAAPHGRTPAAPAILLVQECLQRFEQIEAGIDWCLDRPAAGNGIVVLADARGEMASVHLQQADRRVSWPTDGLLLCGGGVAAEAMLQKREVSDAMLSPAPIEGTGLEAVLGSSATRVVIEPATRALRLVDTRGAGEWLRIEG